MNYLEWETECVECPRGNLEDKFAHFISNVGDILSEIGFPFFVFKYCRGKYQLVYCNNDFLDILGESPRSFPSLKEITPLVSFPQIKILFDRARINGGNVTEHLISSEQGVGEQTISLMKLPQLLERDIYLGGVTYQAIQPHLEKPSPDKCLEKSDSICLSSQSICRVFLNAVFFVMDLLIPGLSGHSIRTAKILWDFADRLNLNKSDKWSFCNGAFLHDLGKLFIPISLINYNGILSREEFKIVKTHPALSASFLARIVHSEDDLMIPLYHHEHWDGSGYNQGLQGEEIPIGARMFALVDVWDAMLSERPYRQAWSQRNVDQYLRNRSGFYFDPDLVPLFLEMVTDPKYTNGVNHFCNPPNPENKSKILTSRFH